MSDHLLQRIDDILSAAKSPSSWETDFLESLQIQVKAGKQLSERQMAKLEEIEERINE